MTNSLTSETATAPPVALSKVPEITIWFWVIKILCTTVGESFADWINVTLGVGLVPTALAFTVVLVVVLVWQVSRERYEPFSYWLTVVVLSVTGTLYTDILTDTFGVPLAVSTTVFAVVLALVFGIWYSRERTLSIHGIVTLPRELFYWLAILVTFALGTAVGDWTLELTGWGPGAAVLLPAALIVAIAIGWRFGANAVLSFWLAYILTRPLGANLGDWLGFPTDQQGLGLGVAATSVIFLIAILGIVVFLTITRADVIERSAAPRTARPQRERVMYGYLAAIALAAASILGWAHAQPHASASAEGPAAIVPIGVGQASEYFPLSDVGTLRGLADETLAAVRSGDRAGALSGAKALETAWDDAQPTLEALDRATWTAIDGRIDAVLTAIRSSNPTTDAQTSALDTLLEALT